MRTVFLGTSEFAVTILRALAESGHRPALVVSRPDRRRGRGRHLTAPPVAVTARELEIAVFQPESVNDEQARERIAEAGAEVICLCAYGALIEEPLLSDYLILNVHPSLLPRWRGAAPVERAIMAGDETTGVSIMRLTAGLDSGPVCARRAEPIRAEDTYGDIARRLAGLGAGLLVGALGESPRWAEQDDSLATYADKIGREDRELDPRRAAVELERAVRALTPHIGAFVRLEDGTRLGVHSAVVVASAEGPADAQISLTGRVPVLRCAEGALELLIVQPPGRRAMSGEDYLRGLHQ